MPYTEKWYVQPGFSSDGTAYVHIERRISATGEPLSWQTKPVAYFELRFNDDTNELMLVKATGTGEADEIVYSEILEP